MYWLSRNKDQLWIEFLGSLLFAFIVSLIILSLQSKMDSDRRDLEVHNANNWNWVRACDIFYITENKPGAVTYTSYEIDSYKQNIEFIRKKYYDGDQDNPYVAILFMMTSMEKANRVYESYLYNKASREKLIEVLNLTSREILPRLKSEEYFGFPDCPEFNY